MEIQCILKTNCLEEFLRCYRNESPQRREAIWRMFQESLFDLFQKNYNLNVKSHILRIFGRMLRYDAALLFHVSEKIAHSFVASLENVVVQLLSCMPPYRYRHASVEQKAEMVKIVSGEGKRESIINDLRNKFQIPESSAEEIYDWIHDFDFVKDLAVHRYILRDQCPCTFCKLMCLCQSFLYGIKAFIQLEEIPNLLNITQLTELFKRNDYHIPNMCVFFATLLASDRTVRTRKLLLKDPDFLEVLERKVLHLEFPDLNPQYLSENIDRVLTHGNEILKILKPIEDLMEEVDAQLYNCGCMVARNDLLPIACELSLNSPKNKWLQRAIDHILENNLTTEEGALPSIEIISSITPGAFLGGENPDYNSEMTFAYESSEEEDTNSCFRSSSTSVTDFPEGDGWETMESISLVDPIEDQPTINIPNDPVPPDFDDVKRQNSFPHVQKAINISPRSDSRSPSFPPRPDVNHSINIEPIQMNSSVSPPHPSRPDRVRRKGSISPVSPPALSRPQQVQSHSSPQSSHFNYSPQDIFPFKRASAVKHESHVSFKESPEIFEADNPLPVPEYNHSVSAPEKKLLSSKNMRRQQSEPNFHRSSHPARIKDPAKLLSPKGLNFGIFQADPILFMNPDLNFDRVGLDYPRERKAIINAIGQSKFNVNHFCCELSLEELSQNDAHIIVCSTHGNKEKVFVEDERGLVLGVPVAKMAQISRLLTKCKIMIYSWCFSQRFGENIGVDHVIAIDQEHTIPDSVIIKFEEHFFKKLFGSEKTVQAAFDEALLLLPDHKDYENYFKLLPKNADHEITLKKIFRNTDDLDEDWFVNDLESLNGLGTLQQLRLPADQITPSNLLDNWMGLQRPRFVANRVFAGYDWLFNSPSRNSNKFLVYHGPPTLGKRVTAMQLACYIKQKHKCPGGICFIRFQNPPRSMHDFLEILVEQILEMGIHPDLTDGIQPVEDSLHHFFKNVKENFALFLTPESPLDDWLPKRHQDGGLFNKICAFLAKICRLDNLYVCTTTTIRVWEVLQKSNLYNMVSTGIRVKTLCPKESLDVIRHEKTKVPKVLNAQTGDRKKLVDELMKSDLFSNGDRRLKYKFPRTARTLIGLVNLVVSGVPVSVIEYALHQGSEPDYHGVKKKLKKERQPKLLDNVKSWMDGIIVLRKELCQWEEFA